MVHNFLEIATDDSIVDRVSFSFIIVLRETWRENFMIFEHCGPVFRKVRVQIPLESTAFLLVNLKLNCNLQNSVSKLWNFVGILLQPC